MRMSLLSAGRVLTSFGSNGVSCYRHDEGRRTPCQGRCDERLRVAQARELLPGHDEGFLSDVHGVCWTRDGHRDAMDVAEISLYEHLERVAVACLGALHELQQISSLCVSKRCRRPRKCSASSRSCFVQTTGS